MRAKRWLIDTLLVPLSRRLSVALSLALSAGSALSWSIAFYWPPITHPLWILQGPIFENYFLNCVKSMDHCTFVSEKTEQQDWNTEKLEGGGKKETLECIVSLCFQCYQCLNSQTAITLPFRPLSGFTADRFTKVQSQEAGSDLETVLMQNQKWVSLSRACSQAALGVPHQILS